MKNSENNNHFSLNSYDPHTHGGQYLENISSASWLSEALFTALDLDLFEILETFGMDGVSADRLSQSSALRPLRSRPFWPCWKARGCFLLCGKLQQYQPDQAYLLSSSPDYLGDAIRFRQTQALQWHHLKSALMANKSISLSEQSDPAPIQK